MRKLLAGAVIALAAGFVVAFGSGAGTHASSMKSAYEGDMIETAGSFMKMIRVGISVRDGNQVVLGAVLHEYKEVQADLFPDHRVAMVMTKGMYHCASGTYMLTYTSFFDEHSKIIDELTKDTTMLAPVVSIPSSQEMAFMCRGLKSTCTAKGCV